MTTTYDLVPEGKVTRSASVYRRGVSNPNDSYATQIDFIDSGLDTARDCVYWSRVNLAVNWAGDPFMPLRTVTVTRTGGGQGYRTLQFDSRVTHRTIDTSTMLAEYEPGVISLDWWETSPGSDAVNKEWDDDAGTSGALVAVPWTRKIEVIHIYVTTLLNVNPIGSVDGMINKVNSNSFEIDGVTYTAKTLLFLAPQSELAKMPNGSTRRKVTYHYVARADTWRRQYRDAAATVLYRDMFESTTFTDPPYNG